MKRRRWEKKAVAERKRERRKGPFIREVATTPIHAKRVGLASRGRIIAVEGRGRPT